MKIFCALLSVVVSIVASGISGTLVLFTTALTTMILFGEATTLTTSVVRIVVNFGVAGLASATTYSEMRRYLGMKLAHV